MPNFYKDLTFGQFYEREFIKVMDFKSFERSEESSEPRNKKQSFLIEDETKKAQKEYDIMVTQNGENIKYEIKCDRLSNKTGNVCIEITCNGKPSGISSTTSDYWAYFVLKEYKQYDLYIIPIDELRDIVFTNDYKVIRGGDNKKC